MRYDRNTVAAWWYREHRIDDMNNAFLRINELTDIGHVLRLVCNFAQSQGVVRQSYHFSPLFDSPTSASTAVIAKGFDAEWLSLYEQRNFRRHDPIPERTMKHGEPLLWTDAMTAAPNSPEQEEYFAAMRAHGLVDGIGVALYGPNCRDAYASFDFGEPIVGDVLLRFNRIKAVAQAAQLRIAALLNEQDAPLTLSKREREVLHWMAQSKSTSDIGTILSISPETVRTYVKRLYKKLDTQTRIGAIIRALKLNLIYNDEIRI